MTRGAFRRRPLGWPVRHRPRRRAQPQRICHRRDQVPGRVPVLGLGQEAGGPAVGDHVREVGSGAGRDHDHGRAGPGTAPGQAAGELGFGVGERMRRRGITQIVLTGIVTIVVGMAMFTQVGAGFASEARSDEGVYWTMLFGAQ